jgi:hypothetical protein
MKNIVTGILFAVVIVFLGGKAISETSNKLIEIKIEGISKVKREILLAANEMKARDAEKALVLAIASIETEKMVVDYPDGDNKSGDAYNVSIYKMNVGMIRNIDSSINPLDIHFDNTKATKVLLTGIRKFGTDKFLTYHRGGETALNDKTNSKDIEPYISAIKQIAKKYQEDPYQLNPYKTDNTRYTVAVPAI